MSYHYVVDSINCRSDCCGDSNSCAILNCATIRQFHKNTFELNHSQFTHLKSTLRYDFTNELLFWCTAKQYWAKNSYLNFLYKFSAVPNCVVVQRAKEPNMKLWMVIVQMFDIHFSMHIWIDREQAKTNAASKYTKDYLVKTNLFNLNTAHPPLEVQEDICLASIKWWWLKHQNTH